nr:MAG TPA: hypothetical protein [Caudoviricetes sp.]
MAIRCASVFLHTKNRENTPIYTRRMELAKICQILKTVLLI